jgi:uncharacterized membrane protein
MVAISLLALAGTVSAACENVTTEPPVESETLAPVHVVSVEPAVGKQGERLDVRIIGEGFTGAVTAAWERDGAPDPRVTILETVLVSSTEVVATISIDPAAETVHYDVTVTRDRKKGIGSEDDRGKAEDAFEVVETTNGYEIIVLNSSSTALSEDEAHYARSWAINDLNTIIGQAPVWLPRAYAWNEDGDASDLLETAGFVYGMFGSSVAFGVNGNGHAVGKITEYHENNGSPYYTTRGFVAVADSLIRLAPLSPDHSSVAAAINDQGTVVGVSRPANDDRADAWAVVWHLRPDGRYADPLPLGVIGRPSNTPERGGWPAINNRGDIVANTRRTAVLWRSQLDGSYESPITLGDPDGERARVYGINDNGWIVGSSGDETFWGANGHAVLWRPADYGNPIKLGRGAARAITSDNRIVGSNGNADDGSGGKTTIWTVDANGHPLDSIHLRWPEGYAGSAGWAINANGWIVGHSWRPGRYVATVWRPLE